MILTKEEFKEKWETEDGGGITFEDIADCYIAWGLGSSPKIRPLPKVADQVLLTCGCEKYFEID